MTTQAYAGRTVETDDEGYLARPADWTREIGEAIAKELSIALSPRHWEVIDFARADFAAQGQTPGLRRISLRTSVPIKELYALFPDGPVKKIARIGGIPKPKSCL